MQRLQAVSPRRASGIAQWAAAVAASLLAMSVSAAIAVAQPSPPEEPPGSGEPAKSVTPQAGAPAAPALPEADKQNGGDASKAGATESGTHTTQRDPAASRGAEPATARPQQDDAPAANAAPPDAGKPTETTTEPGSQPATNGVAADPAAAGGGNVTAGNKPAATEPPARAAKETPRAEPAAEQSLRIAVWPGAFGEAQRGVTIDRFKSRRRDTDIDVTTRNADRIESLEAALSGLDAGEFSAAEVEAGCRTGLFRKIAETGSLAQIVSEASDDFLAGSLRACGVGAFAWSHILAYKASAFVKRSPDSLADVFDTKRFPGKRAFIKEPKYLLEVALLADGVAAADIYATLATEEGRDRALAKLSTIRDDITWVGSSRDAHAELDSGRAVMAQTFSGKAFFAAARGADLGLIWDGQIYAMTYWAIPAASRKATAAGEFVRFATEPQQLAAVAERFPYGPTRGSALPLATRHAATGLALERYLPTAVANMKSAVALDETWWIENGTDVDATFTSWLERARP